MKSEKKYNLLAISWILISLEVLFWILLGVIYYFLIQSNGGMRFQNEWFFYGFLTLPAILLLYLISIRIKNRNLKLLGSSNIISFIVPHISSFNLVAKFILFRMAVFFLILGVIDPKSGSKIEEVETSGADIMIALDVSESMKAEDMLPDRLSAAKRAIEQLISTRAGDRIGLVVFAGEAFVQLPITTDYAVAKMFLSSVSTNSIGTQGTDIGNAIYLCLDSFDPQSTANKAIIVFTDGENHEPLAIEAAEQAVEDGVTVHVVGVGGTEGVPIPIKDAYGRNKGFKDDGAGNPVVTALNETVLADIARSGNGIMTRSSGKIVLLNDLNRSLDQMEKGDLGTVQFADFEHHFRLFLIIALLLFLLDTVIPERKIRWKNV